MSLPSAIKLFIDPRTGDAFGNFAGTTSLTNPVFTLGDTATVELYLVESTGLNTYPRQEIGFPTSPGIRVAVGAIDESPLAGTWTLSYGGDTTTALAFNATPAVVQAALNLLASITAAGGVTVAKIGDNYNIVFNANGARTELTTNGAALIPLSAATVASLQTGDANKPAIYLVHLQRTVAGLATSFTPTAASAITVESLTAWDGTKATYRVSISPDPKGGSFSLSFDAQTGTDVSTAAISVGASALDVQNALSIGALADGKVSVTQVGAYAYDITVKTQPATAGLTADAAGLLSFAGYKGELNLNTAEAISLLDGAPLVQTTLEVEITSNSKTLTVLQIACTLQNAVIDAGAVQPLVLDTYLSQTVADGRYFKLSQNLADGTAGTMRTNLGVYSTSQVDTALALKANTSHTHIIGDVTGLQTALDGKANLSEPVFSGKIQTPTIKNILNADLVIDSYNDTGAGTHYLHKFTPFDGKLVLATNGGGLTFPDGTTQSTAATTPDLTPYALLAGATFSGQVNVGSMVQNGARTEIQTSSIGATVSLTKGGSQQAVISIGEAFDNNPFVFISGASGTASIHSGKFFSGGLFNGVEPYARTDGATFTGKVNMASLGDSSPSINLGTQCDSAPASATNGDIWISNAASPKLTFRTINTNFSVPVLNQFNTFTGQMVIDTTSASVAALRVTQRGAGNAIEVEDSTTPDSTRFVVDQFGKVGVGIAPDATAALRVDANGIRFNTGSTQTVAFVDAPSDGNYYVRRNGAWVQCIIHTQGGHNYLTI
jgi:hypothetical protein